MADAMTRRRLFGLVPCALFVPGLALGQAPQDDKSKALAAFPRQDLDLVREIVIASHGDLPKVTEIIKRSPGLSKAAWDWGFGDWETAIGAASHTGSREIAELLIANGARADVFTFVMFGNLAAVKAIVEANPGIQKTPGPHGITMLTHAKIAGEKAKDVQDYLQSLGDADNKATSLPLTDAEKEVYVGEYRFGTGTEDRLKVEKNKQGNLTIKRGTQFGRSLNKVEDSGFAPGGAPSVRIRFTVENGKAVSLAVHDPEPIVTALRV